MKYLLDTNVYIRALRDEAVRRELAVWQRRLAPALYLHAVVVAELLVGARDEKALERWRRAWVEPAERVGRLVAPGVGTWERAARIVVRLVARGRLSPGGVPAGFLNDCLLAATAREEGFTIVTHNVGDFRLIGEAEPGLRFVAPWP